MKKIEQRRINVGIGAGLNIWTVNVLGNEIRMACFYVKRKNQKNFEINRKKGEKLHHVVIVGSNYIL